jgi:hypothetical protein
LSNIATTPLVIASFLALVSLVQPAADRLRLPYAVVLAVVGIAVGGLSSFLLYTPLINAFDDVVRPIVNLPFSASVFLDVFLSGHGLTADKNPDRNARPLLGVRDSINYRGARPMKSLSATFVVTALLALAGPVQAQTIPPMQPGPMQQLPYQQTPPPWMQDDGSSSDHPIPMPGDRSGDRLNAQYRDGIDVPPGRGLPADWNRR